MQRILSRAVRVTMHYHSRKRRLGVQKRLANAQQIIRGLMLQRNPRRDSGMHEQIVIIAVPQPARRSGASFP
jgi:hypothetical protein